MLTSEEEGLAILVICDNVTIECPREQETERETRNIDRQWEGDNSKERERESEGERNV